MRITHTCSLALDWLGAAILLLVDGFMNTADSAVEAWLAENLGLGLVRVQGRGKEAARQRTSSMIRSCSVQCQQRV
jgi:hypothetical protein